MVSTVYNLIDFNNKQKKHYSLVAHISSMFERFEDKELIFPNEVTL